MIAVFTKNEYGDAWNEYYEIDGVDSQKFIEYVGDFVCFTDEVNGEVVSASRYIKDQIKRNELDYKICSKLVNKYKNYTDDQWAQKDMEYWKKLVGMSGCFCPPSDSYRRSVENLPKLTQEIKLLKGILK